MNLAHWTTALETGLFTGLLAVLVTFTPAGKLYANRYGNAAVVAVLSMLGDAYSHASRYRAPYLEHVLTGVVAGALALIASYVFEDRAVRIRRALNYVRHFRAH